MSCSEGSCWSHHSSFNLHFQQKLFHLPRMNPDSPPRGKAGLCSPLTLTSTFSLYPSELALCSPRRAHSPAPGLCHWHVWLLWLLASFSRALLRGNTDVTTDSLCTPDPPHTLLLHMHAPTPPDPLMFPPLFCACDIQTVHTRFSLYASLYGFVTYSLPLLYAFFLLFTPTVSKFSDLFKKSKGTNSPIYFWAWKVAFPYFWSTSTCTVCMLQEQWMNVCFSSVL